MFVFYNNSKPHPVHIKYLQRWKKNNFESFDGEVRIV